MEEDLMFKFKADIAKVHIPRRLNNPFASFVPEISRIAAKEFQAFIAIESQNWNHDFCIERGKMFGVLVVQKEDGNVRYLGALSGKLPENVTVNKFVPSVFDDATGDFFINKGMTELTEIGLQIKELDHPTDLASLKEERKSKSIALQRRLFENYQFLNLSGKQSNLLEIFKLHSNGSPPSAAGECAAPKLLQYAIKQGLKPLALSEFWWGNDAKNKERLHQSFYPACESRCRPILEYMLEDTSLFLRQREVAELENLTIHKPS